MKSVGLLRFAGGFRRGGMGDMGDFQCIHIDCMGF